MYIMYKTWNGYLKKKQEIIYAYTYIILYVRTFPFRATTKNIFGFQISNGSMELGQNLRQTLEFLVSVCFKHLKNIDLIENIN